jgi:TolB-like protein/tetratricopeptide (TPR) repeat protein/predicted Ser/Thr protein kinase
MIGQTIAHYRVLSKLGEGGMGEVYLAEDTRLKRNVALKFLPTHLSADKDTLERFEREAQATAALNHPNIVTIYEIGEHEGQVYLCMEYVEGQSLRELISADPCAINKALDITMQVAEGLSKAHHAGIVHRDIKPENVILDTDGRARILDFGLAKLKGVSPLTKDATTLGTIRYMSPEQARGEEVDHRTDIWSLGVVLYELLSGKTPFKGEYEQAVAYSILNTDPEPADVPETLWQVISKMLEKDPEARYLQVGEVLTLLTDLKVSVTPSTTSAPVATQAQWTRSPMAWAVGVIIVIGVIGFGIIQRQPVTGLQEPERTMIAVLPFKNLGPPEDEYFAEGITEEITNRLAAVRALGVISRTSADLYKESKLTAKEIGQELGVDYILEARVRWNRPVGSPSRVRVTPQLIRVSDDIHIWAEQYEREMDDIFTVQSSITDAVVRQLNITLLEPERRIIEARPTDNMEAYQAYLQARKYDTGADLLENWQLALQLHERAVELDPGFALAYARMSMVHSILYLWRKDFTDARLTKAKETVDRALALQPDLAEARLALGYYYYHGLREYGRALAEFTIAAELRPPTSEIIAAIGYLRRRQGRWEEAERQLRDALVLSPNDKYVMGQLALLLTSVRRYEEAQGILERRIAIAPDQSETYFWMAMNRWNWHGSTKESREIIAMMPMRKDYWSTSAQYIQEKFERRFMAASQRLSTSTFSEIPMEDVSRLLSVAELYELIGDAERARTVYDSVRIAFEKKVQTQPKNPTVRKNLGIAYAGLGRKEDAIRAGQMAVELLPVTKDALDGPKMVWGLALIHTMIGEYDAALEQIDYLLSIPSFMSVPLLKLDPTWDPLRDHPRYQKIIDKYKGDVQ